MSSTHEEAESSERLTEQRSCLPICHIACRDCQVTDMPDQLETSRETLMYFHNNMAASAMLTSSSALSVFSLIISNPQYSKDREPRTLFPSTHGLVTMLKICTFLGAGPGDRYSGFPSILSPRLITPLNEVPRTHENPSNDKEANSNLP